MTHHRSDSASACGRRTGSLFTCAAERSHVLVLVHTRAVHDDKGKHYRTAKLEDDAGYEIGAFHLRAKQLLGD
jgi:hypothetical protein